MASCSLVVSEFAFNVNRLPLMFAAKIEMWAKYRVCSVVRDGSPDEAGLMGHNRYRLLADIIFFDVKLHLFVISHLSATSSFSLVRLE